VARQQSEPQQFLFIFTKVGLPEDHNDLEAKRFEEGEGGNLIPVISVHKPLAALSDFPSLVAESVRIFKDWKVVFIAILSGKMGIAPSDSEIDESLEMMIDSINKGDISKFVAFDQEGNPLQFF
jgi:hypothetical protein